MEPIHLVTFLAIIVIIVVVLSMLDLAITFVTYLAALVAEWFMDRADERYTCKHKIRSTSHLTQVTRCFECGEVLEDD